MIEIKHKTTAAIMLTINADSLVSANLRSANLSGADLSGANLSGANIGGTDLIVYQSGPYTACIQSDNTRIGCEYHSSDDWLSWSPDDVAEMDNGAREYWEESGPIVKAAIMALRARKGAK